MMSLVQIFHRASLESVELSLRAAGYPGDMAALIQADLESSGFSGVRLSPILDEINGFRDMFKVFAPPEVISKVMEFLQESKPDFRFVARPTDDMTLHSGYRAYEIHGGD